MCKCKGNDKLLVTDTLPITVSCPGLLHAQIWTVDPYAIVSVGPCAVKSAVKSNTLAPEWNDSFVLYVRDAAHDLLKVHAFLWLCFACKCKIRGV